MTLFRRAALIAFAGLVIGLIHSYCAPISLRPENNATPPVQESTGGDSAQPAGNGADAEPPKGDPAAPQQAVPVKPTETASPQQTSQKPVEASAAPTPPAARPNYFIDVARAKELFDRGRAQGDVYFLDARPAKDYLALHIAGAMHVPPEAFSGRAPQKVLDYLPGMTVVIYCHGATCTDSEAVMIRLQNLKRDIGPIYIMNDGFDAWKDRSLPVERGPDTFGT